MSTSTRSFASPSASPSPSDPPHDVIVVGGRVAGASTALLLARAGLRVLVLERSAQGTDTISTHALMRGGVLQLDRWGLLDAVIAAGTPPVRGTVYQYGGERRHIAIKPAHGVDALYAPRRTVLDPLLVSAARTAGADVRFGSTVTSLVWERGRVVGVRADAAGRATEHRARLVIGADGIHSLVARRVGADMRHRARTFSAVTYGYWSDVEVDAYEWTFDRRASTGAIPTSAGQVCVFASGRPADIGRGGVAVIEEALANVDPSLRRRLANGRRPRRAITWRGAPGFLRRAHGPGWALVGDAGYFRDPIVAHGMTDALRDAELLARAVIAGADSERGLVVELERFEDTRDRLSLQLLDTAERIASHDWDELEIDGLVRCISSVSSAEVDLLAGLDEPLRAPVSAGGAR